MSRKDDDDEIEETEAPTTREMLEGFGTVLTSIGEGQEDLAETLEDLEAWVEDDERDDDTGAQDLTRATRILGELTTMNAMLEGMVAHLQDAVEVMGKDLGWKPPKKKHKTRRRNTNRDG